MPNVHRTARGVSVDIDQLRLANETTVAVGNQRVNARGDVLDAKGNVITTKDEVMARHYNTNRTFNIPTDQPVLESNKEAKASQRAQIDMIDAQKLHDTIEKLTQQLAEKNALLQSQPDEDIVQDVQEQINEIEEDVVESPSQLRGGLAAAIAKNKELLDSKTKSKRD